MMEWDVRYWKRLPACFVVLRKDNENIPFLIWFTMWFDFYYCMWYIYNKKSEIYHICKEEVYEI